MAAAIIIALQMLFGASAAQQPTSAQIQQASASCHVQPSGIVVTDQTTVY